MCTTKYEVSRVFEQRNKSFGKLLLEVFFKLMVKWVKNFKKPSESHVKLPFPHTIGVMRFYMIFF